MTTDDHICVSTDDDEIIEVVGNYGLKVPFKRPSHLGTDTATTNDVLVHAINFYEAREDFYDVLVLLQPTSPLRKAAQVKEAISLYDESIDMVVSVKESHSASVICSENEVGFLEFCFNKSGARRQDIQKYYEYNGAVYIIKIHSLKEIGLSGFTFKKKYVMDEMSSIDIDTQLDWIIIESILKSQKL